jgi:hypothetical protein
MIRGFMGRDHITLKTMWNRKFGEEKDRRGGMTRKVEGEHDTRVQGERPH